MIASVHIADVGARSALGIVRKAPAPGSINGLRNAGVGLAAPLRSALLPSVQLGRVALVAFWDDDAALDRFLRDDPLAAKLESGWRLRLAPLRAYGSWPGLPESVPSQRNVDHEGPVAVVTMGRLMPSQAIRFLRASAKAEASVLKAPGLIWATGFARPPRFVATCSLWESTKALSTYAYGRSDPGHPDAIASGEAKPFHSQQVFIRFRPYDSHGSLGGKNPLAAACMPAAGAATDPR
jgi:hypothetical protein